jgi:farnesyl diphosphate synthase
MIEKSIKSQIHHHEAYLSALITDLDSPAPRIKEAIGYSLLSGGKRLRPSLVYLCGALLQVPEATLDILAAAIELTHCYSLIHDDLPAMDNDDIRRGQPTCHRAFDEATAILAGDAMQILAIEILLDRLPHHLSLDRVISVSQVLIKASGTAGMISGQSLDLNEMDKPNLTESRLREIHSLKTGKLISACIDMVIAAANPQTDTIQALSVFATHLGLVFQMQDDYLDKYDHDQLGKGRGSDEANHKTTFASLYPKEDLRKLIHHHFSAAQQALSALGESAEALKAFVSGLEQRIS